MPFFLSQDPTYHSFTFNSRFSYELKHKVHLSKSVCGIFHSQFRFVFAKVDIFVQLKVWTLLTLKGRNSFQNQNNKKATLKFPPRPDF